jgi:hypothetical protein
MNIMFGGHQCGKRIYSLLNFVNEVARYHLVQRGDFSTGQVYDNYKAKTTIYSKCESDKFFVGQGSYYTAIKCVNCGWEECIHDG